MKKYRKYLFLFILTASALCGSFSIPGWVQEAAPAVETVTISRQDVSLTVRCSGTLENTASYPVESEWPLYVETVAVEEGQDVQAGDLLFTVDRTASVQAAALLSGLAADGESLAAGTSLSESVLAGQVPEAVCAPAAGRVTNLTVSAGEMYMPGKTALTLAGADALQMRASFSESIISSIEPGQTATITGNGFPGKSYTGRIVSLAETAQQVVRTTGTETVVEGVISIEGDSADLRAGYNVQADIVTDVLEDILIIPYEAIEQDEENRQYVYQLVDGWACKRYIQTGAETAAGMEVLAGAEAGWQLILQPAGLEGDCVRVTHPSAEEAA